MKKNDRRLLLFAAVGGALVLSEALYLVLYAPWARTPGAFMAVALVNSVLYGLVWFLLGKEEVASSRGLVLLIVLSGIAARASLIALEPVVSDDIYRYIWDGKVQSHGIDPYRYSADDPALMALHSGMLPARINHAGMKTIYPPVAEWLFWVSYGAAGESVAGFKIPLFFSEVATIALLLLLLAELKLPPKNVALYALCPLPIMHFMIDGHVDAFAFPFLVGFLLLFRKGRTGAASVLLGLAAVVKIYPLFLAPLFLKESGRKRYLAGLLAAAVVAGAYLPYVLMQGSPFESLSIYSKHWAANGSVFNLVYIVLGDNQRAHIVSGVLTAAWVLGVIFAPGSFESRAFLAFFGLFLLSPTVHPWYLAWLAVLLPLYFRWSGLAFIGLVNVAVVSVICYRGTGVWAEPPWMLLVEYVPVYLLIALELKERKVLGAAAAGP